MTAVRILSAHMLGEMLGSTDHHLDGMFIVPIYAAKMGRTILRRAGQDVYHPPPYIHCAFLLLFVHVLTVPITTVNLRLGNYLAMIAFTGIVLHRAGHACAAHPFPEQANRRALTKAGRNCNVTSEFSSSSHSSMLLQSLRPSMRWLLSPGCRSFSSLGLFRICTLNSSDASSRNICHTRWRL